MALQAEIVPFTLRSGAGTQTVLLSRYPSMTPKGFIFFSIIPAGANRGCLNYGFSDGTTSIGQAASLVEQFGVNLHARQSSRDYCLNAVHAQAFFGGASPQVLGYVSAVAAGSFTLTFDANSMVGTQWYAVVLGGAGVSIKCGIVRASAGMPHTETLGFDAVAVLSLNCPYAPGVEFFPFPPRGVFYQGTFFYTRLGLAVPCGPNQAGFGTNGGDFSLDYANGQVAGVSYLECGSVVGGVPAPTRFVSSYPSGDFILSGSNADNNSDTGFGYLAIGGSGVVANLVPITQPAAVGVRNTSITTITPQVAVFVSTNCPTSTVTNADAKLTVGMTDGVTQFSGWLGATRGVGFPYASHSRGTTAGAVLLATATGPYASTVNGQASCVLAPEILALDWSVVDGTAREVWALVLGADGAAVAPCGGPEPIVCAPQPPAIPDNPVAPVDAGATAAGADGTVVN